ncbi:heparan sulfate 2-O-sulfotransferase pipe [Zophobas morio]|uniref:heparan sulfate 2-O-sulfotransferase pipe n=1 Tax=Zophobas morio TaxID=2755281 RepID=UPI003083DE34
MDLLSRYRRFSIPKRTSELIALVAVSTTLFLFIHTRALHSRLKEMQFKLQPEDIASSNEFGSTLVKELQDITVTSLTDANAISNLDPVFTNNTRKAKQDIIFFNRVPKVGSQTLMELVRRLSIKNNFGFHQDHVQRVETIRLSPEDQAALSSLVSSYEPPGVYIKHVCFTNFSQFGQPHPIYINLVRDPVERVISWYYYVRAPWYYVERKLAFPDIPLPDPKWLKKDFEYCVLSGDRECTYLTGEVHEGIGDHRRQSMFFCGHRSECLPFNTKGALEKAKRVVEQHYAVVGVLEDLNKTLIVLENYIPKFFTGASSIYWNEISRFNHINKNGFKPSVSEDVKKKVRSNFTREIEFYQFCKQRLHKQYLALKTSNEIRI